MQNTETWEDLYLKRKNAAIRWLLVALLAFTAIAGVILASILLPSCVAFAGEIPKSDTREVAIILWAESAGDPEGWEAKLNTYYSTKRGTESILDSMKRVSSAYRTKSNQYRIAKSQNFNAWQMKRWSSLLNTVKNFQPDQDWNYVHHEKMEACHSKDRSFYKSRSDAISHLKKAWGNNVDFVNTKKIGCEEYFLVKG